MKEKPSILRRGWWWTVMSIAAALSIIPVIWTFSTSLKSQREAQQFPPSVVPHDVRVSNYTTLLSSRDFLSSATTSIVVTLCVTLLVLACALPCAYGLVRFRSLGGRLVLLLIALAQTVPAIVFMVPLYSITQKVGMYDTRQVLVLVYAGLLTPFATLIMVSFVRSIPLEIEEAAQVDGAGRWKVLVRIVMPMCRPGLATAAVFTSLYAWNEFMVAAVLGGERARPLPVYISSFITQKTIEWGPLTAAVCVVLFPVLVAVVLLQRQLVSGLAAGALKS